MIKDYSSLSYLLPIFFTFFRKQYFLITIHHIITATISILYNNGYKSIKYIDILNSIVYFFIQTFLWILYFKERKLYHNIIIFLCALLALFFYKKYKKGDSKNKILYELWHYYGGIASSLVVI